MILKKISMSATIQLLAICFLVSFAISQTPSPALLVLEKEDKSPAIVDPATLKVARRVSLGRPKVVARGRFADNTKHEAWRGHALLKVTERSGRRSHRCVTMVRRPSAPIEFSIL